MAPNRRNSQDSAVDSGSSKDTSASREFDTVNGPWPCRAPKGCLYNDGSNEEHILITKDDLKAGLEAVVKLVCSNEQCDQSPYTHTACFQAFEETVLGKYK